MNIKNLHAGSKRAIIIGAGYAGISAAVRLAMNGIKPIVLEARKFPGGRAFSFIDQTTGEEIDNGQHIMMGAYKNFLELLSILGTQQNLDFFHGIKIPFIDKSGLKSVFNTELFPGKMGMLLGLLMLKGVSLQSRINALDFLISVGFGRKKYLGLSVYEMLKIKLQSDSMIKRFWEPMCLAVMNLSPKASDATVFVEAIRRAFFSEKDNARLIIPKSGLSGLLTPFEEFIAKNGGEVSFSAGVDEIIFDNSRVSGVRVGDEIFTADYYISAVQPFQLQKMIKNEFHSKNFNYLSNFSYSPIISIFLWFDKEFMKERICAMLGSKVHWAFNRRITITHGKFIESRIPCHIALTISGADDLIDLTKEEIIRICIVDINTAFPNARYAKLIHSVVIKEKHATIINNPMLNSIRPSFITDYINLYIAGDWTDTGLPATIESACESGFKVSDLILQDV